MSTLHAFPRLHANSSSTNKLHYTPVSLEADSPSTDPAPILPLFLFGLLAALGTSFLVCQVPAAFMHSWTAFFLRSIAYLAGVAAAGIAGTQVLWILLSEKTTLNLRALLVTFAASWAFLPSIVFFYREHSVYLLLVTSITTAITAASLKRLVAVSTVEAQFTIQLPEPSVLQPNAPPDFSGLPTTSRRSLFWIIGISIAAQLSILLWLLNQIDLACLLLAIPSFVLAWQTTANTLSAVAPPKHNRSARSYVLYLIALLFTAIALLPWLDLPLAIRLNHLLGRAAIRSQNFHSHQQLALDASAFTSIVLYPPPSKEKSKIVPPKPHAPTLGQQLAAAKPLVIPFDGPYWYFQLPDTKPSPNAHIMHGKPTTVNMHSTNDDPLQMEAHQRLGSAIAIDCCKAIDLALTNADNRPGLIQVEVLLTDTSDPVHHTQDLGQQTIASSQPTHFALVRGPVNETLHFNIPSSRLRHFNEITVIFLPSEERALGGAKVSIQNFTLIPR
jgi:hypothetical protein